MYEPDRINKENPDYLKILDSKLIRIEHWPKNLNIYIFENNAITEEYDNRIAQICFNQAQRFY